MNLSVTILELAVVLLGLTILLVDLWLPPERKSRLITEAEKSIIAYHEVGHAIVMRSMPGADPVRSVAFERAGLIGLAQNPKTIERMRALLETGKPLKN